MKMATAILTFAFVAAFASGAAANGAFTFEGFSYAVPTDDAIGSTLYVYGIANPPTPGTPTPIPLDFATKQYTLVAALIQTGKTGTLATQLNDTYATGSWAIYEDASTPASYASLGTFSDGTAILTGSLSGFTASLQTDVFGLAYGNGVGSYLYVGGTRYADILATAPLDCSFLASVIHGGSPVFNPMPSAPFTRTFNAKMVCTEGVPTEQRSWGTLKDSYHP
jgi:hypothetical protein